ncbi:hypothetical protein PC9H_010204 [Pleurotus ostreatus]|uniref:Uncharacterized protein n=1 Tax=Pleurotus ostreatus TaxID=5322 RepID=A0A8H6ZN85_PLEOS|nr:uncharacterized protein PC9H_010204 [Pleurotus ostreatus]KAF7424893.1 hypothetical protein PC9H_010204 [Pleurotus ostreatus]
MSEGGHKTSPYKFEEDFMFVENITTDYASVTQFIECQPLVEHSTLSLWFAEPLHVRRESLRNLRILDVSLHSASIIALGRHITHLKINSNAHNMNNATHWANLLDLDSAALRAVVGLSLQTSSSLPAGKVGCPHVEPRTIATGCLCESYAMLVKLGAAKGFD